MIQLIKSDRNRYPSCSVGHYDITMEEHAERERSTEQDGEDETVSDCFDPCAENLMNRSSNGDKFTCENCHRMYRLETRFNDHKGEFNEPVEDKNPFQGQHRLRVRLWCDKRMEFLEVEVSAMQSHIIFAELVTSKINC